MEATRRGGLRARTCQTAVTNKRKDNQRKPLLPNLRVAEVINRVSFWGHFKEHFNEIYIDLFGVFPRKWRMPIIIFLVLGAIVFADIMIKIFKIISHIESIR
jgi:hypothetical protein